MKRMISMLMIWVGVMVLTTISFADDMDDVKAAVEAHWTALNAGDMDAVAERHTPDFNGFLMDNSLLWTYASRKEQKANFKALSEAGIKFNMQIRHLDVKVYGNTAVAVFLRGRVDNLARRYNHTGASKGYRSVGQARRYVERSTSP